MAVINREQIAELCTRTIQRYGIVGAAVGICYEDEVYTEGFGFNHHQYRIPVSPDTLFMVCSIAKTCTAALIMQLVEANKISLDNKVCQYLPDLCLQDMDVAQAVTIRHLLNHTGAWFGDVLHGDDRSWDKNAFQAYASKMEVCTQLAPIGQYSYNNLGYILLGAILEKVYQKTFEEVIQQELFDKLAMRETALHPYTIQTFLSAVGHTEDVEGNYKVNAVHNGRALLSIGSVFSSVRDMLRYCQAYLNQGAFNNARILEAGTVEQMLKPSAYLTEKLAWGLGWGIELGYKYPILFHTGSSPHGFSTLLVMLPEKHFALAVLTNSSSGFRLRDLLKKTLLRDLFDIDISDPTNIPQAPAQVQEYLGTYAFGVFHLTLELIAGCLTIVVHWLRPGENGQENRILILEPRAVDCIGSDRFKVRDPNMAFPHIDFIRDADGQITGLISSLRYHNRLR
jgi:CubicO group peptidase (beta-lactamase class C family)